MRRRGRRQLWRRVSYLPEATYFKPLGKHVSEIEEVNLLVEEAEAVRLKDLEGYDHEASAQKMSISRSTFSRLLDSARQKLADALLNGKAIRIEGGNFEMAIRHFKCLHGHEWQVPFEKMIVSPPELCPECKTPSFMPMFAPGQVPNWGRGHHHGRGARNQGHR